jgi:hypothetical protein
MGNGPRLSSFSFAHSTAQACIVSREAGGNLGGGSLVSGGGGTGKRVFDGAFSTGTFSSFGLCGVRVAPMGATVFFFAFSRGFPETTLLAMGLASVVVAA